MFSFTVMCLFVAGAFPGAFFLLARLVTSLFLGAAFFLGAGFFTPFFGLVTTLATGGGRTVLGRCHGDVTAACHDARMRGRNEHTCYK